MSVNEIGNCDAFEYVSVQCSSEGKKMDRKTVKKRGKFRLCCYPGCKRDDQLALFQWPEREKNISKFAAWEAFVKEKYPDFVLPAQKSHRYLCEKHFSAKFFMPYDDHLGRLYKRIHPEAVPSRHLEAQTSRKRTNRSFECASEQNDSKVDLNIPNFVSVEQIRSRDDDQPIRHPNIPTPGPVKSEPEEANEDFEFINVSCGEAIGQFKTEEKLVVSEKMPCTSRTFVPIEADLLCPNKCFACSALMKNSLMYPFRMNRDYLKLWLVYCDRLYLFPKVSSYTFEEFEDFRKNARLCRRHFSPLQFTTSKRLGLFPNSFPDVIETMPTSDPESVEFYKRILLEPSLKSRSDKLKAMVKHCCDLTVNEVQIKHENAEVLVGSTNVEEPLIRRKPVEHSCTVCPEIECLHRRIGQRKDICLQAAVELLKEGKNLNQIADMFGCCPRTLSRRLKEAGTSKKEIELSVENLANGMGE